MENGNERARLHFKAHFPNLKESTIRNFKKAYKEQLKKKAQVTALPTMPRGRPSLLMELDKKLLRFLNAMRARDGVINSHVVRATADAFIRSNHSPGLQKLLHASFMDSISLQVNGLHQKNGNNGSTSCSKGII